MKIGEIIQRFQSLHSKGLNKIKTRLTDRHIYNAMITCRSRLLTQKANKKQYISDWNYITLPCVEMITVEKHDCPCVPTQGCHVVRSKFPIPKAVSGLGDNYIKLVTDIMQETKFSKTSVVTERYNSGNKYTKSKPTYYIHDKYLYVVNTKNIEVISVTGLFEDVLSVSKFPSYCEKECLDCKKCVNILEQEFPLDLDLIDTLVNLISDELETFIPQSRSKQQAAQRQQQQQQQNE
jgi:hypothetical protein